MVIHTRIHIIFMMEKSEFDLYFQCPNYILTATSMGISRVVRQTTENYFLL